MYPSGQLYGHHQGCSNLRAVNKEIKMGVVGWHNLDNKSVNKTVKLFEAKEMACNALTRVPNTAAISNYKKSSRLSKTPDMTDKSKRRLCKDYSTLIENFLWSHRQKRMVNRKFCLLCRSKQTKRRSHSEISTVEEILVNSSILIGSVNTISLAHMIFDTKRGWKKGKLLKASYPFSHC